jgi:hypothetical protein
MADYSLINDFINSNSKADIIVFFVLLSVIFIIILRLVLYISIRLSSPSDSPILIKGMVDATKMRVIEQDPSVKGAIPIKRSKNEDGIEFTWSTWLNIGSTWTNDPAGSTVGEDKLQHIFHKGNIDTNGNPYPLNGPGLYLSSDNNNLVVIMNTVDSISGNKINVGNIPRNKWFNVIIRLSDQYTVDVYINGKLVKRHILDSIPKQNYGNVYVGLNGGFTGYVSSLRYYSYALSNIDIVNLLRDGPNLLLLSGDDSQTYDSGQQYLSLQWFLSSHSSSY